jgi:hypothetical protein
VHRVLVGVGMGLSEIHSRTQHLWLGIASFQVSVPLQGIDNLGFKAQHPRFAHIPRLVFHTAPRAQSPDHTPRRQTKTRRSLSTEKWAAADNGPGEEHRWEIDCYAKIQRTVEFVAGVGGGMSAGKKVSIVGID